jgi:hypothetical protein
MKGLFLLDAEEARRAKLARETAAAEDGSPGGEPAAGEPEPPAGPGKPLEDYLARWHGNWRGSSSVR